MTVFAILAGVGAAAGDLFILAGLLGAGLLLLWRAANLFTGRRRHAPELILWWAILGWLLGFICLLSFVVAGYTGSFGRIFAALTVPAAAGLLLLTVILFVGARVLDRAGNRRRQARGVKVA